MTNAVCDDLRAASGAAEPGISRRGLLAAPAAVALAGAVVQTAQAQAQPAPAAPAHVLGGGASGEMFHTVETRYGRVQGIANGNIKEFKGVPYGAPTGGGRRFMPPRPPAPWTGVLECVGYRPISPQTPADLRSDYAMLIMWDRHVGCGGMGEDVLSLNIWTPGVNDGARRPVLVSFHGGGWETGSGNAPGYDGAQLARFGDAVVVTVNHRLSSFGYLDLAAVGAPPEFAFAGVTGVMDMVASLEWVRDNISAFGGDPGKVMIFGQSGGGAKTSALMGTPAAVGLFHRAAVQSGSLLRFASREQGERNARALLAAAGIPASRAAELQKLSWQELLAAQVQAAATPGVSFTPVLDGAYLTHDPFDPVAPAATANVPMIISTTLEDAALRLTNFDLDEAGLRALMIQRFGPAGAEALSLYRARYPNTSPFLVQAQAFTDATARRNATLQAERKAALGAAPAYLYLWAWPTPAFDGKFGAVHGIDVSASFHNYRDGTVDVGSRSGRVMCDRLAAAWIAFAHAGDPNCEALPHWAPYNATQRPTMIFDEETRLENDPRREIRAFWDAHPPAA